MILILRGIELERRIKKYSSAFESLDFLLVIENMNSITCEVVIAFGLILQNSSKGGRGERLRI